MHYQASFDSVPPARFSGSILKVGAALLSGAGLGLLAVSLPKHQSTSSVDVTNLFGGLGGRTSLRQSPLTSADRQAVLASLPGGSWKDLALASMEASQGCRRDLSLKANPKFRAALANMDPKSKAQWENLNVMVQAKKKAAEDGNEYGLPGVLPPLNWFDPAGFSTDVDEAKLLYFREAELKHGRICMSASLGFLVAERYHPLYGGSIDDPSVFAATNSKLESFWVALVLLAGGVEYASSERLQSLGSGGEPGDLGYDPLGLLPTDPEKLEEIQNKEILNGRFAMISFLGMVAEELVTKEKLHGIEPLLSR